MDTLHLSIPIINGGNIGDLLSWFFGLFIAVQTIVRAIPTPKERNIKHPLLRIIHLLFNKSNVQWRDDEAVLNTAIQKSLFLAIQRDPSIMSVLEETINTFENQSQINIDEAVERKVKELLETRITPKKLVAMKQSLTK